jgi:hypothetical protein
MLNSFKFYLHTIQFYVSHLIIRKGQGKFVPVRAMNAYGGMETQIH